MPVEAGKEPDRPHEQLCERNARRRGGGRSHLRTGLHNNFTDNRELYRENVCIWPEEDLANSVTTAKTGPFEQITWFENEGINHGYQGMNRT